MKDGFMKHKRKLWLMINKLYEYGYDDGYKRGLKEGYENGLNEVEAYHLGIEQGEKNIVEHFADSLKEVTDKHYNKGLCDAWECAIKIYSMSAEEVINIFGGCSNWINFTAIDAMQMIEEYERSKTWKIRSDGTPRK